MSRVSAFEWGAIIAWVLGGIAQSIGMNFNPFIAAGILLLLALIFD